ncbi:phosphonoacetaldehyde hydrolase [Candidatus Poribacteria bacterium]|nr:phosphonoacetaldehyde hydrolase [Candidatus Poribacteria bacterium]
MEREFAYDRRYTGSLKAVILDWAGTTLDYGCYAPAVVFIDVYKRKGVPITIEEARAPMGAHKLVHIRKISRIPAVAKRWEEEHGRRPTEDDVQAMFEDFIPLQLACLADYGELIPGALEAVADFRARGLKIGSTTGYTTEMGDILFAEAERRGDSPDVAVCASEVPAGRPEPWMCLQNAFNLQVYPMEAIVKVGDTLPDIEEGLNASMWTIGLAKTGNEIGLNAEEIEALPEDDFQERLANAYKRLHQTGAHYVVDGIWDVPPILDKINARLSRGERP